MIRRPLLRRTTSRPVGLYCAAAALLALSGCAGGGAGGGAAGRGDGEQRFVAGDGTVVMMDAGSRRAVPTFTGTTLDGRHFDLGALRGSVVVLNVWGSWCAPCRAEAPALERVRRASAAQGVQFVGVNVKDEPAAARAFVHRFGLRYPSVDGNDGAAQLALRSVLPGAIPSTIVLDRQGRLAAAVTGSVTEPGLRRALRPVLAEAA